jgi:hypothetical protein
MNDLIKDINHDFGEFLQFTLSAYDKAVEGVSNTMRACSVVVAPVKKEYIHIAFEDIENLKQDLDERDEQWHVVQEPEWSYEQCSMIQVITN